MAYDLGNARCVLFGGFDGSVRMAATMLWDGQQWTAANPAVEPPPRGSHAMAYDLWRGRVVLFGGFGAGGALGDTWLWNGTIWSQAFPAHVPAARGGHAMAYSWLTGRTVMFGGSLASNALTNDTWEWDGTDWTQRLLAPIPPARSGHAMAYDLQRNRVVLFGGLPDDSARTWLYDGSTWTAVATPTHPPAAAFAPMTFDFAAARTLLQSSLAPANASVTSLWSWDGTSWSQVPPAGALALPARSAGALAYDFARARTVMFGGHDLVSRGDTWEWDGTAWSTSMPFARTDARLAFDTARGAALLFGGIDASRVPTTQPPVFLADTWEWRGGAWHYLQPANAPSGRAAFGIAYDAARGVTVLFGGVRSTSELADTWEWNGSNWNQRATSVQPLARQRPAMTFDAARQEVVLFGGFSTALYGSLQDTWTWNGSAWTRQTPGVQPSVRPGAAFAFDAARGRCVLFSGMPMQTAVSNDTWEWDGTNWIARAPAHAPSARFGGVFAYDAPRRRTVLVGGFPVGGSHALDETWEWDGIDWTQRVVIGPTVTPSDAGAFDTIANRTIVFGTLRGSAAYGETWSYGPVNPASIAPFGAGCAGSAGSAGVPVLRTDGGSLPWLGDTLALAVEPTSANPLVVLALGFSRTSFGGAALPASLDPIGMAGCTLLVSLDELQLGVANGTRADFALSVPTTTSFVGLQFFAQAALADAHGNPTVVSNALEGRIGNR